jgi:hypothetical protein
MAAIGKTHAKPHAADAKNDAGRMADVADFGEAGLDYLSATALRNGSIIPSLDKIDDMFQNACQWENLPCRPSV